MNQLFPEGMAKTKPSKLTNITLRGFSGGLNGVANDKAMDARFLKYNRNFRRTASGTQKLRYGSKWIADVAGAVSGDIVDMFHFNNRNIVVTDEGEIASINSTGTVTTIWDDVLAALLPGTPAGWSSGLTSIDFVPFKTELVIHNGIDKPITIDSNFNTTYLQDLATGSNVNVPIGKFGCTVSNYHCIAGIPATPTTIYVSSIGTAGTFPGDPAPNDSISIDVGAYAPDGASEIRGIAGFRTKLIVFFQGQSLVVQLGNYTGEDGEIHTPTFPDTLPQFGLLGHRCISAVENDLNFAGYDGIASAKRNLFSDNIESDYLSHYIEPLYRHAVGQQTTDDVILKSFIVYDKLSHDMMIFEASDHAFVHSANSKMRYSAWSEFVTPEWTCGCASSLGRVYFAQGTRVYQYGNGVFSGENYAADKLLDRDESWAINTSYGEGRIVYDTVGLKSYVCLESHTSSNTTFANDRENDDTLWEEYLGETISFNLETAWLDGKDPMKTKQAKFISMSSDGTAAFTVYAYVDDLFNIDWEVRYALIDYDNSYLVDYDNVVLVSTEIELVPPELTMGFVGNQAGGAGVAVPVYGTGRRSGDPRLYGFPLKFKTLKIMIFGQTREPLEINTLSFLFSRGRYKR